MQFQDLTEAVFSNNDFPTMIELLNFGAFDASNTNSTGVVFDSSMLGGGPFFGALSPHRFNLFRFRLVCGCFQAPLRGGWDYGANSHQKPYWVVTNYALHFLMLSLGKRNDSSVLCTTFMSDRTGH